MSTISPFTTTSNETVNRSGSFFRSIFPWQIPPAAEAQTGSLEHPDRPVGSLGIPATSKWILVWGFVSRQTPWEGAWKEAINRIMMGTVQ